MERKFSKKSVVGFSQLWLFKTAELCTRGELCRKVQFFLHTFWCSLPKGLSQNLIFPCLLFIQSLVCQKSTSIENFSPGKWGHNSHKNKYHVARLKCVCISSFFTILRNFVLFFLPHHMRLQSALINHPWKSNLVFPSQKKLIFHFHSFGQWVH